MATWIHCRCSAGYHGIWTSSSSKDCDWHLHWNHWIHVRCFHHPHSFECCADRGIVWLEFCGGKWSSLWKGNKKNILNSNLFWMIKSIKSRYRNLLPQNQPLKHQSLQQPPPQHQDQNQKWRQGQETLQSTWRFGKGKPHGLTTNPSEELKGSWRNTCSNYTRFKNWGTCQVQGFPCLHAIGKTVRMHPLGTLDVKEKMSEKESRTILTGFHWNKHQINTNV